MAIAPLIDQNLPGVIIRGYITMHDPITEKLYNGPTPLFVQDMH